MIFTKERIKNMFLYGMEILENQKDINNNINEAIDVLCDGYPVFTGDAIITDGYIYTLASLFTNPDVVSEYIYWLLYDEGGLIVIDEKSYNIKTAEDLFDIVLEEYAHD